MILTPNYDKIVNFLYEENDIISKYLIECYQEYIFNIKNKKSKLIIDDVMNEYIKKEEFYKYVFNHFNPSFSSELYDSYDKVIRKLINLHKEYETNTLKKINNTRWL